MTNIELTDQEVELFKQFRQYQDSFQKLLENNFFGIKGAAGIVHFDENSQIRKIEVPHIVIYNLTIVKKS